MQSAELNFNARLVHNFQDSAAIFKIVLSLKQLILEYMAPSLVATHDFKAGMESNRTLFTTACLIMVENTPDQPLVKLIVHLRGECHWEHLYRSPLKCNFFCFLLQNINNLEQAFMKIKFNG